VEQSYAVMLESKSGIEVRIQDYIAQIRAENGPNRSTDQGFGAAKSKTDFGREHRQQFVAKLLRDPVVQNVLEEKVFNEDLKQFEISPDVSLTEEDLLKMK
jgi:hypothetical protein